METEWDEPKNAAKKAKHGLDFASFEGFDGGPAAVIRDDRFDYSEDRFIAVRRIDGVPHAVVFTLRGGTMRLISFRRANEEEVARHE